MTQVMRHSQWGQRIERASELASAHPFAAEGLRFYTSLLKLQLDLYNEAGKAFANSPSESEPHFLRQQLGNSLLPPKFGAFVASVQEFAPGPLARAATRLASQGPERWCGAIESFLREGLPCAAPAAQDSFESSDSTPPESLLAWLFLQPFAEYLANRSKSAKSHVAPSTCPICGSKPIVGVLRPEGDGGQKSLVCMLCAHEWVFRRICCPACGEEREPQMGFYAASEIPHVRVDVCDTCHTYLKTVDLTKLGLALPVADELAAIPLDLWAREHGYTKFQVNLLGI
jgi:formate dehydrogenase maturation protein FdhE